MSPRRRPGRRVDAAGRMLRASSCRRALPMRSSTARAPARCARSGHRILARHASAHDALHRLRRATPRPLRPLPHARALRRGPAASRNFRANRYPFRATSHFLYFVGASISGRRAALRARADGRLFASRPTPTTRSGTAPRPSLAELRDSLGVDAVRPLAEIDAVLAGLGSAATLPTNDAASAAWLSARRGTLHRAARRATPSRPTSPDAALADAMIALRLCHDARRGDAAPRRRRRRARRAHAGRHARHPPRLAPRPTCRRDARPSSGAPASRTRTAPSSRCTARSSTTSATTTRSRPAISCSPTWAARRPRGWAGDITRTWPVSGRFSPTQRAIYDVVLAAQRRGHRKGAPRRRATATCTWPPAAQSSRACGCSASSRGDVDGLARARRRAVFFPHGVGHLLGLDVHDMEDLGDRAGYAPGTDAQRPLRRRAPPPRSRPRPRHGR